MRKRDSAILLSVSMSESMHGDSKIMEPLVARVAVAFLRTCYSHFFSKAYLFLAHTTFAKFFSNVPGAFFQNFQNEMSRSPCTRES